MIMAFKNNCQLPVGAILFSSKYFATLCFNSVWSECLTEGNLGTEKDTDMNEG